MSSVTTIDRYAAEQQADLLAVLEALSDERIVASGDRIPVVQLSEELRVYYPESGWSSVRHELVDAGLLVDDGEAVGLAIGVRDDVRAALGRHRVKHVIAWRDLELAEGEILRAFADYCGSELDDVTVAAMGTIGDGQLARWVRLEGYRQGTTMELRTSLLGVQALACEPIVVLTSLDGAEDGLIGALMEDGNLRNRLTVLDLDRLEKVSCGPNPLFVHMEWFLREVFGVKVVPNPTLTQALVSSGIISMGMG